MRGAIELGLRCPQNVNGIAVDPQPDWTFDNLLLELGSIETKLMSTLNFSTPFDKEQPRKLKSSKENYCTRGYVMHVSDHEMSISDCETDEEVDNSSMFPGKRFVIDEPCVSHFSEYGPLIGTDYQLMDRVGIAEGALQELTHELQLCVSDEMRNDVSNLEENVNDENEKFISQNAEVEQWRKIQKEREMKMDLHHRRAIAEALDNHLTAIQRDHELFSLVEEKRIRDDAAREESKRKDKALLEEKIRQERIKEEEIRLQAERAKAAAEAERLAAEAAAAAAKHAVETIRDVVDKGVNHSKETLTQSTSSRYGDEEQLQLSATNVIRASKRALELEKRRQQVYENLAMEIESLKASSNQSHRRHGQNFSRLIKTITVSVESVRTKAVELISVINSPAFPQSFSILAFAEKVVSNCENCQKSNGFIFACCRVVVLVTSKIPLAMDIVIAELNKVCMYTVPKYIEFSRVSFQSREAYFKSIGFKEVDGKIESTDSYVERMSSYMKLYGALVQADIDGFQNPHGLKEGWAWLARFLNSLPANLYTAVALQHFIEMCGYALYRKYRNQFEKLLRIIARDFVSSLKEGNSDSHNSKLNKVKTSILTYIESNQFKKEPEGLQLRAHLESNSNEYF